MFALLLVGVGFKLGSYAVTLVAGGVLGFLYGGRVERKAAAALAAAGAAASKAVSDAAKKL